MADIVQFSEADLHVMRDLLAWWRRQPGNVPGKRGPERPPPKAPDVYVALTPSAGIPPLTDVPGTGTLVHEEPGSASCAIYRLDDDTGELFAAVDVTRTVYNLAESAIDGGIFIPVWRDKWGAWLAQPSGDGSFFAQIGNRTEVQEVGTSTSFTPYAGTGPQAIFLYDFFQVAPGFGWTWPAVSGGITGTAAAKEFNNNDSVSSGKIVRMYPGYDGRLVGGIMEYVFFYPKALVNVTLAGSCVSGAPVVTPTLTYD